MDGVSPLRRASVVAVLLLGWASLADDDTLSTLGSFIDNEYVRNLEIDPEQNDFEPNRQAREVRSGHFVLVKPTPLPSPTLVVVSAEMCEMLHLNEATCNSPLFTSLFSGADISDTVPGFSVSWATPYALSIYGQEVQPNGAGLHGNGYGDGRAISIGEVLLPSGGKAVRGVSSCS